MTGCAPGKTTAQDADAVAGTQCSGSNGEGVADSRQRKRMPELERISIVT